MNRDKAIAIATMVNTPGWAYLKEHMNEIMRRTQEDMIDMDDSAKAEQVRVGLKYTRQWRDVFFGAAEALANYTDEAIEDFANLNFGVENNGRK